MARYEDNSPVGNTCPKINKVIDFLTNIEWDLDNENEVDLSIECADMIKVMEEIREANSALRDWGNEEYNYKNEYEKEKIELEKEIQNLKYDLSEMEDKIKKLEE